MREILDGISNTLLVGELQTFHGAPWVLGPTVNEVQFGSDHRSGGHFALADCSVRFFTSERGIAEFEAMLSPASGDL